jgi:hypothetical protein
MKRYFLLMLLIGAMFLAGCVTPASGYLPAAAISQNGFATDAAAQHTADGKEIKLWGFVDHANLYGDADAQEILGEWWSGDGPSATAWRFNLMAHADDQAGQSFAVHVPNDEGRDELLRNFLADAEAQRPTKVFVTGRLFTFDAPTNLANRTGLVMELDSSQAILLEERP